MGSASFPAIHTSEHIRAIDLARDLDPVADLIELCFPIHQDPDGQTYIQEMRKAAREMRLIGWLAGLSEQYLGQSTGFVWVENGQIVGNLSLIPLNKNGRRIYLIANVAVHPEHRRRGIARRLTQKALSFLARQNESQVWLQVRDDNPAAIGLYTSLGFSEQASRTTWRIRPRDFNPAGVPTGAALSVRRWARCDWSLHQTWLEEAYPHNIQWNLPVHFQRFSPGIFQAVSNYLDGTKLKSWTVFAGNACQGVITWQKTTTYANNLWLAFPADREEDTLPGGMRYVLKRLSPSHPFSVDYPKGRFSDQFTALGFFEFRTLNWMRREL
jgi:ribosomal protein S18 acetylase RimI-like enzyme